MIKKTPSLKREIQELKEESLWSQIEAYSHENTKKGIICKQSAGGV